MVDDKKIEASLSVLMDYKDGGLTFNQAVNRFGFLLNLEQGVAEKYVKGLHRDNIINFKKKRKKWKNS